ncbi:MAG: hypothetical protein ISS87_02605, partial [Candidatus Pacebacteria bacterium]|nr:hypothetical protein [Candidatus Paceibacterota bacterium]
WFGIFLLQKINLTTADLGRLLKNGELILKGNFDVLYTNFYSYTNPDFSFINHHWLSGIIFFLIHQVVGFTGLHLFYIILSLITFLIFFDLAQKQIGANLSAVLCLIIIPFLAQRREIRPEIFTYLFSAIFFWILWNYKEKLISFKWLFVLPIIQIIWVNTHLYCFLGPMIVGLFLFEKILLYLKKQQGSIKILAIVFVLTIIAISINPSGLKQYTYPFQVFQNHEYRLIETQSVLFLEKLGFIKNPNFLLFKIIFLMVFLSYIVSYLLNREEFSIVNLFLGIGLGLAAFFAIRNFTLFGFFAIPIIAINLKNISIHKIEQTDILCLGLVIFIITLFTHYQSIPLSNNSFGLGLMPKINKSAEFFLANNIEGQIFNNYDIGGYLIYHLFPEKKVFVDNRPEGYPGYFFNETYIPLQENNEVWDEKQSFYDFNVIFFARHDATPWAQKFLVERVKDSDWTPVFVDNYTIIFLKENNGNQKIIEKYAIPKEYFKGL